MSEWCRASQLSPVVKEHFNRIATPLGCANSFATSGFSTRRGKHSIAFYFSGCQMKKRVPKRNREKNKRKGTP